MDTTNVATESDFIHRSPVVDIRSHALLGQLTDDVISKFISYFECVEFHPGQKLVSRGDSASAMWLVFDGEVQSDDPSALFLSGVSPVLLGQESAGLSVYDNTFFAITKVCAWRIPSVAVRQVCSLVPGLESALIRSLDSVYRPVPVLNNNKIAGGSTDFKRLLGWSLALAIPPGLYVWTAVMGLPLQSSMYLAIFGMVIVMWVFSLVDDYIAPLAGLVCILFVGLAPPSVVLSSFASPGLVTLISVFAMAAMISGTGLSNRVLLWLLLRLPDTPAWRQMTLLLYGLTLSLGTPSANNRMALMMPAFDDMARGLRLPDRSASLTALFVATYGGAMLFSSSLATSKSVTISVIGFLPLHLQDYYAGLFWISAAGFFTVGMVLLHMLGVRWWVRTEQESSTVSRLILNDRMKLLGKTSIAEKTTAVVFLLFLVGSLTTSIHHVPQSGVAGAVLIGLLVCGVMSKVDFQKKIDWPMIIFLIATDCLIKTMSYLGLSHELSHALRDSVTFVDGSVLVFLLLSLTVVLLMRLLLPIPAGMLLSAVMLLPVAQVEGISPWICIFAIAVFSDIWFFRYQNNIYGIALSAGIENRIQESIFLRHNMWMNGGRVLLVFCSVPVWDWMGLA